VLVFLDLLLQTVQLSFSFLVVELIAVAFLFNKVLVAFFMYPAIFKDTFYLEKVAATGVR